MFRQLFDAYPGVVTNKKRMEHLCPAAGEHDRNALATGLGGGFSM